MNKKLLLASVMVSVMGFSSLFAQDEEVKIQAEQYLSCDCPHTEEEVTEEAPLSTQEEEAATVKALSCDKCGGLTEEDATVKALSCDKCGGLTEEDETQESALS